MEDVQNLSVDDFEVIEITVGSSTSPVKPARKKSKPRRKRVVRPKQRGLYKPRSKHTPAECASTVKEEDCSSDSSVLSQLLPKECFIDCADTSHEASRQQQGGASSGSSDNVDSSYVEDGNEHSYARTPEPDDGNDRIFIDQDQEFDATQQSSLTKNAERETKKADDSTDILIPYVSNPTDGPGIDVSRVPQNATVNPPMTAISEALNLLECILPDDWIVIGDSKGFHFLQLSPIGIKAIQREIFLQYNGSVSVIVHCVPLQDGNDLSKLHPEPVIFSDENYQPFCQKGLTLCWGMAQFSVCVGADFEDGKELWSDIPNTYVDLNPYLETTYETSCRSTRCHRLIPLRFNSYRCLECAKVMKILKERNKSAQNVNLSDKATNKSLTKEQAQAKLKSVQQKYRKSEKRCAYLQSKIERLQEVLEKEGVDIEEDVRKYLANVLEKTNLSEEQQIFLVEQVKYATAKDPRAHRWHPAMIRLAIKIKSHSSAAYEALRDSGAVKIPHSRTLFDYTHYIKTKVGVNEDLLKMYVSEVKKQDDPENQYHTHIFDEMYISQNLVYRQSDGALVGYAHLDEVDKELKKFEAFLNNARIKI